VLETLTLEELLTEALEVQEPPPPSPPPPPPPAGPLLVLGDLLREGLPLPELLLAAEPEELGEALAALLVRALWEALAQGELLREPLGVLEGTEEPEGEPELL